MTTPVNTSELRKQVEQPEIEEPIMRIEAGPRFIPYDGAYESFITDTFKAFSISNTYSFSTKKEDLYWLLGANINWFKPQIRVTDYTVTYQEFENDPNRDPAEYYDTVEFERRSQSQLNFLFGLEYRHNIRFLPQISARGFLGVEDKTVRYYTGQYYHPLGDRSYMEEQSHGPQINKLSGLIGAEIFIIPKANPFASFYLGYNHAFLDANARIQPGQFYFGLNASFDSSID